MDLDVHLFTGHELGHVSLRNNVNRSLLQFHQLNAIHRGRILVYVYRGEIELGKPSSEITLCSVGILHVGMVEVRKDHVDLESY